MALSNYEWFMRNDFDEYAGKWIAIDNRKVLDSARDFGHLMRKVETKFPTVKPFVTRISNKLLRLLS